MDELVTYGMAALAVIFLGIVIAAYGIFLAILWLARAIISGDLPLVSGIIMGIFAAAFAYGAVGLWLKKTGAI